MIDTDKYEGHTENWYVDWPMATDEGDVIIGTKSIGRFKRPDAQLIADAPLLLAEVKRLRQEIKDYDACLQNLWDNELIPDDTDIWDEVKEL